FDANLARKPGGKLFNRAIFDFLIFYAQHGAVRQAQEQHAESLRQAFDALFQDRDFVSAVDRDTAGIQNTVRRLASWGKALNETCGLNLPLPELIEVDGEQHIQCAEL